MMAGTGWLLAYGLANTVSAAWATGGLIVDVARKLRPGRPDPRVAGWCKHELRPFILPAILFIHMYSVAQYHDPFNAWRLFMTALWLWLWWTDRNDDDRWKRRAKAAAGVVRNLGHRLVVVPDGTP